MCVLLPIDLECLSPYQRVFFFQWRAVNREMRLTEVLGRRDRVLSSKRDIYVNPTTTAQGTFWKMRQNVRAEG